jgi:hypothetical protein
MLLLNEIARGGRSLDPAEAAGDVNRWGTPPLEVVYSTNSERVAGEIDTTAYDEIVNIWNNELKPTAITHLFPQGFFKDVPVVKSVTPYQDYRIAQYIPGKIIIQYEDGLASAALMWTHQTQEGYVDGAVITLQGIFYMENPAAIKILRHELIKTLFKGEINSTQTGTYFNGHVSDMPETIPLDDKLVVKGTYSRPTNWKANDDSR